MTSADDKSPRDRIKSTIPLTSTERALHAIANMTHDEIKKLATAIDTDPSSQAALRKIDAMF
ncbi:MAG: hypothetical protein WAY88_00765 [Minisyncoccia bacterium]